MADMTISEECKRRHRGQPCLKHYAADMVTVTSTADCAVWCPILNKRIDAQYVEPQREAAE